MNASRWILALVVLALLVLAFVFLAPVLLPFLLAFLLAYLGQPLVARLEQLRLPRIVAVVLVFVAGFGALVLAVTALVPRLQHSVATLVASVPTYVAWLRAIVTPWFDQIGLDPRPLLDPALWRGQAEAHWQELARNAGGALLSLTQTGARAAATLAGLLLVPVVSFYLLRDWDGIWTRMLALVPPDLRANVRRLVQETDEVLGSFLRGQLLVMLALATFYATGLWLIGLELALPIGIGAGLLGFVPYLGFGLGLCGALIAALVQFPDWMPVLWVAAVFGAGQALEGTVLTPQLVGDRIGLHPVAVIFSVLAGGQLFGFFGVLVALPCAAVGLVWLRELKRSYKASALYSRRPRRRSRPS